MNTESTPLPANGNAQLSDHMIGDRSSDVAPTSPTSARSLFAPATVGKRPDSAIGSNAGEMAAPEAPSFSTPPSNELLPKRRRIAKAKGATGTSVAGGKTIQRRRRNSKLSELPSMPLDILLEAIIIYFRWHTVKSHKSTRYSDSWSPRI